MNKQKGKEKMANILSEPYYEKETDTLSGWEEEYCDKKTESLYNAGYRKVYDKITSEFIKIWMCSNDNFCLPFFKYNSMHNGMRVNKAYTLKELGLFEGQQ